MRPLIELWRESRRRAARRRARRRRSPARRVYIRTGRSWLVIGPPSLAGAWDQLWTWML